MKKTIVITGATNGIGKEAALALARKGHHLVLAARDQARAERVRDELKAAAPGAEVELVLGDLSRPSEAARMAAELRHRLGRLDVLINNAGAYFAKRETTPDGYEKSFALNHLGYFVLTSSLLELLERSAPARIVSVSSDAHRAGKIDFEDLQFARRKWVGGWSAYSQSKLANILMTRELARRLVGKNVTANAVHPGFVASGFGHNNSGAWNWFLKGLQVVARTPEKGAETIVHLATSPDVEGVTGKYFHDLKERHPAPQALDDDSAKRLWEISEGLIRSAHRAA
ncbi:MAG: SDR family oxidoreductase [Myxococcaceae bacterium]